MHLAKRGRYSEYLSRGDTSLSDPDIPGKANQPGVSGDLAEPEHDEIERRRLFLDVQRYTRRLEQQIQQQVVVIEDAYEETIHRLVTRLTLSRQGDGCPHSSDRHV